MVERTIPQNSHFHALIDDIARQVLFCGRRWKPDSWKRLLVGAFVQIERNEAEARGDPDPFPEPSMLVEGLEEGVVVQLGVQTRAFSKERASLFLEYLYCYGAEENVTWSPPAKRVIRGMSVRY